MQCIPSLHRRLYREQLCFTPCLHSFQRDYLVMLNDLLAPPALCLSPLVLAL